MCRLLYVSYYWCHGESLFISIGGVQYQHWPILRVLWKHWNTRQLTKVRAPTPPICRNGAVAWGRSTLHTVYYTEHGASYCCQSADPKHTGLLHTSLSLEHSHTHTPNRQFHGAVHCPYHTCSDRRTVCHSSFHCWFIPAMPRAMKTTPKNRKNWAEQTTTQYNAVNTCQYSSYTWSDLLSLISHAIAIHVMPL